MKKHVLTPLLLSLLGFSAIKAQPTITSANTYAIGDVLTSQPVDATLVSEGSSGSNQTWDFSGIAPVGTPITQNVLSPGSTPYASSFSTADVAVNDGGSNYLYYTSNSSALSLIGVGASTTLTQLTDPQVFFQFPFTYNTTFTDDVSGSFSTGAYVIGSRTGNISFTADGYGTLILPSSVVSNVLRIKYMQFITDFYDLGGGNTFTSVTKSKTYIWMTPGNKNVLMDISYDTVTVGGFPSFLNSAFYYPLNVSTEDLLPSTVQVLLIPNPATDIATISFILDKSGAIRLSVINELAQEVKILETSEVPTGLFTREINLRDLTKGIYFIKVDRGNQNLFTRRIVKE